jgi:hypothetical protein
MAFNYITLHAEELHDLNSSSNIFSGDQIKNVTGRNCTSGAGKVKVEHAVKV